MQTNPIWNWLDEWLTGHASAPPAGAAVGARRERFVIGRTLTALASLIAMPAYLLSARMPALLEAAAILTWLAPLLAAFVASRRGSLVAAQAIVTLALGACAAAAAALLPLPAMAAWAGGMLIVADAAAFPTRRGLGLAVLMALPGPVAVLLSGHGAAPAGTGDPGAIALSVAVAFALGHALSFLVVEARLAARLREQASPAALGETATLRAIDDLVTWHDGQGAVLHATGAASRLLDCAPADLRGSGLFTLVHVADRPAYLTTLSEAAHRRRPVAAQFRVRTRAGRGAPAWLWMEMHAQALHEPSDPRCAVVGVLRDVSRTRREVYAAHEEHRKALRANVAHVDLMASVSHELRAQLGAILGHAELMAGRNMPVSSEQRQEHARAIHRSGQQMLEFVNTLAELSAIESGQFALSIERIDAAALLRECCAEMALPAQKAAVLLRPEFASEPPVFHADRRACRQILLNLLSDAVRSTPRGATIAVKVRRQADSVVFTIRDTGAGTARHPLRQAEADVRNHSRSRLSQAGGLGLSLARGLVRLHRGDLRIDEAPSAGVSLVVSLPIGREDPSAQAAIPRAFLALAPRRDADPVVSIERRSRTMPDRSRDEASRPISIAG